MTTVHDPLAVREQVRAFALTLPGAAERFPWGECVVKVGSKVFVFVGVGTHPPGINVELKDPQAHEHAMSVPGARGSRSPSPGRRPPPRCCATGSRRATA